MIDQSLTKLTSNGGAIHEQDTAQGYSNVSLLELWIEHIQLVEGVQNLVIDQSLTLK
ncbi:hypothetical protein MKY98_03715 [Paenibacillus sp. FSL M8-0228]|uniref:hypothetical protein n=1 Tax=Paenibacillus TaxID=44249 RepID=UPI00159F1A3B|nr:MULTISPECIES: hypothetical protein [Paenibacillus]MBO3282889.1 hypothetical protein [Paenibacillus polymyxa]MBP1309625.1 hypothetical protein [Paenibacillus sp. 1182]